MSHGRRPPLVTAAQLLKRFRATGSGRGGSRAIFLGHFADDAADIHHGALVSSGADVLDTIRGPYSEVYFTSVRADHFRVAYDLAADWSRHQMVYLHPRADGAFADFQILLDGVQGGIFHDQHQIRCREHRRQDAVLETIGKMSRFDAQGIRSARAYRYVFHDASSISVGPLTDSALGRTGAQSRRSAGRRAA